MTTPAICYVGRDLTDPHDQTYLFEMRPNSAGKDGIALACQIVEWNTATFGPSGYASRWCGFSKWWFRDEADATHFRLRWC